MYAILKMLLYCTVLFIYDKYGYSIVIIMSVLINMLML